MKTFVPALLATTTLICVPSMARSAEDTVAQKPQSPEPAGQPADQVARPAPPAEPPPAPPSQTPPPPEQERLQAPGPAAGQSPPGRWVHTAEYGWVWIPQGDAYSYGSYAYVYRPTFGWAWLVAPWEWGWWPWPYYGIHGWWGPWGFPWRGHHPWPRFGWRGHGWLGPRVLPAPPPRMAPAPRVAPAPRRMGRR